MYGWQGEGIAFHIVHRKASSHEHSPKEAGPKVCGRQAAVRQGGQPARHDELQGQCRPRRRRRRGRQRALTILPCLRPAPSGAGSFRKAMGYCRLAYNWSFAERERRPFKFLSSPRLQSMEYVRTRRNCL